MNEQELTEAINKAVEEVAEKYGIEIVGCQKFKCHFISDASSYKRLEFEAEYIFNRIGIA